MNTLVVPGGDLRELGARLGEGGDDGSSSQPPRLNAMDGGVLASIIITFETAKECEPRAGNRHNNEVS
jgi:hypothetical protein